MTFCWLGAYLPKLVSTVSTADGGKISANWGDFQILAPRACKLLIGNKTKVDLSLGIVTGSLLLEDWNWEIDTGGQGWNW